MPSILRSAHPSCFARLSSYRAESTRELRDKYRPDAHLIFLNSIAHFQHHDWNEHNIDLNARFVYRTIDRILGIVLPAEASEERVLILNGFSQKNVANEKSCTAIVRSILIASSAVRVSRSSASSNA